MSLCWNSVSSPCQQLAYVGNPFTGRLLSLIHQGGVVITIKVNPKLSLGYILSQSAGLDKVLETLVHSIYLFFFLVEIARIFFFFLLNYSNKTAVGATGDQLTPVLIDIDSVCLA